jgi:F0F1-type ATP synthase membrane subunit c/vacuolar-type H+-ATPase subunit K
VGLGALKYACRQHYEALIAFVGKSLGEGEKYYICGILFRISKKRNKIMWFIIFIATLGIFALIGGIVVAYRNRDILFPTRQLA